MTILEISPAAAGNSSWGHNNAHMYDNDRKVF